MLTTIHEWLAPHVETTYILMKIIAVTMVLVIIEAKWRQHEQ